MSTGRLFIKTYAVAVEISTADDHPFRHIWLAPKSVVGDDPLKGVIILLSNPHSPTNLGYYNSSSQWILAQASLDEFVDMYRILQTEKSVQFRYAAAEPAAGIYKDLKWFQICAGDEIPGAGLALLWQRRVMA